MRTFGLVAATAALAGLALAAAGALGAQAAPDRSGARSHPVAHTRSAPPSRPWAHHRPTWPGRPAATTPAATTPAVTTPPVTTPPASSTAAPSPSTPATSPSPTGQPSTGTPVLPPAGRWDYQIGGTAQYTPAPVAVSRDNGDKPWPGVYSICYVNAFQSQPGDSSLKASWLVVGGKYVEDPGWPGEYMLDTRGHRSQLVTAFTSVLSSCAAKGFKAVEFDNLDSYDRSRGGLTRADNVAYVKDLITAAHRLGLAAAQKNAAELVGQAPFDFALVESCLKYSECRDFTTAYRVVLDVEYQEEMSAATFQRSCAAAVQSGQAPSFVFRDRDVSASGVRTWCTAQAA